MYWNSSEHWHGHRYGDDRCWRRRRQHGHGWLVAVVIIGLIILTHGWILILPLLLLAALLLAVFTLPRVFYHMQQHDWYSDWSTQWHEKRKRAFDDWIDQRTEEKPKRGADDIDYV